MFTSAFIFEVKEYDDDFRALDQQILSIAESTEGYLGKESWQTADGSRINSTYYWDNEEALKTFSRHPKHIEAKRQYAKWYKGYHVVIAEVVRTYGDNVLNHITPNERLNRAD